MDQIILFQHTQFRGAHKHIFNDELNLNNVDDRFILIKDQGTGLGFGGLQEEVEFKNFNDQTSSIIITGGTWQFFRDSEFRNPIGAPFTGPKLINNVGDIDLQNDAISSIKKVN